MRRKILFIALCCLFAGQYVSAQKVFVKGNMTDISMVTPQTELFLKSKLFKFDEGINQHIQGKMFVRRFRHCQSAIKIKSEYPVTVYLAATTPVINKKWKSLNESFLSGNQKFYLYSYELDNRWVTVPDMNGNSSLLFAPQIERVDLPTVPGTVIYNSDNSDRNFVTDPALAVLPNGDYIAGCRARFSGKTGFVRLYRSTNKGKTWEVLSEIPEVGFYSLFVHDSVLYLMGTKGGFNHMVILRSDDGGRNWTTPIDSKHGLLSGESKSYHSASVPVAYAKGRIWRAMEDNLPKGKRYFRAFMMSAPINANLLDSAAWTRSEALPYDSTWLGTDRTFNGWLEGNAVVTREGNVVDILRIEERNFDGKAVMVRISDDGKQAYFDPQMDIIDLPGASKKFVIRFDSVSNLYWAITNHVFKQDLGKEHCGLLRNRLVLVSSSDLRDWQVRDTLISHDDPHFHGFQYIDWLIEGNDIIAVSRTAFDDKNGLPKRQHDANYLTFHRFKSFRKCLKTKK